MSDERLYIVTYDIADQRRWRRVFKAMHGYGEWLQLPFFSAALPAAAAPSWRHGCVIW